MAGDKDSVSDERLQCPECNKCFARKRSLLMHMNTHTGEKPYQCSECSKCFARRGSLWYHKRLHTHGKQFHCSTCSKQFTRREHLLSHARVHTGEKPYKCSLCSKCFCGKATLLNHMNVHSLGNLCQCPKCKKFFGQKNSALHGKCHPEGTMYRCSICTNSYACKFRYLFHTVTHMKEKPYHCVECNRAFADKVNLYTHIDDHAEQNVSPDDESCQRETSVTQETEDNLTKTLPSVEAVYCPEGEQEPVVGDPVDLSAASELEDPLKLDIEPEVDVPVECIKEEITVIKHE